MHVRRRNPACQCTWNVQSMYVSTEFPGTMKRRQASRHPVASRYASHRCVNGQYQYISRTFCSYSGSSHPFHPFSLSMIIYQKCLHQSKPTKRSIRKGRWTSMRTFYRSKKCYVGVKKSYVGLYKSYVGDKKSYVGVKKSYVGLYKSYVGDKKSYVGDKKSYVGV